MNIAIYCAFDTPATIEYAKATIAYLEKEGHPLSLDKRLINHLTEKPKTYDVFNPEGTIDSRIDFLFFKANSENEIPAIPEPTIK